MAWLRKSEGTAHLYTRVFPQASTEDHKHTDVPQDPQRFPCKDSTLREREGTAPQGSQPFRRSFSTPLSRMLPPRTTCISAQPAFAQLHLYSSHSASIHRLLHTRTHCCTKESATTSLRRFSTPGEGRHRSRREPALPPLLFHSSLPDASTENHMHKHRLLTPNSSRKSSVCQEGARPAVSWINTSPA